jgi:hypothetical protein
MKELSFQSSSSCYGSFSISVHTTGLVFNALLVIFLLHVLIVSFYEVH